MTAVWILWSAIGTRGLSAAGLQPSQCHDGYGQQRHGRLGTFDVRPDQALSKDRVQWTMSVSPQQAGKPDSVAVLPIRPLTNQLGDFLEELRQVLDENQIAQRSVSYMLSSNTSLSFPLCEGQWLEFGVAGGATINWAAKYRDAVCGPHSPHVNGFDTFTGLPEAWHGFKQGHFDRKGKFPPVEHNAKLHKGLFSDSLPKFLEDLDDSVQGRRDSMQTTVTYLHIDCDLYAGARDALALLASRIHPGCVLVFDDLLHYPDYREHEVKALWEFLHASQRRLQVVGIFGPQTGKMNAVDLDPAADQGYFRQSVAFVVL